MRPEDLVRKIREQYGEAAILDLIKKEILTKRNLGGVFKMSALVDYDAVDIPHFLHWNEKPIVNQQYIGDFLSINPKEQSFDIIYDAFGALQYATERGGRQKSIDTLQKIQEILSDGGIFIGTVVLRDSETLGLIRETFEESNGSRIFISQSPMKTSYRLLFRKEKSIPNDMIHSCQPNDTII